MSIDLQLKPSCVGCGLSKELYGSNCKHMTLCLSCGKKMAQNRVKCIECGLTVTRLIREYNVRICPNSDKNYFIGRFMAGVPDFSNKQNTDNKWTLQKEGTQTRQLNDALREKFKNKPWLLEDESGQSHYHGPLEGGQSATYYLLMQQGKEFAAIPAGSWYNFNKVAQYKQLTLEEAEEKMKNRRKTADGYERWMMKAANTGPAAFGELGKFEEKESGGGSGGGKGRKKSGGDDDEGNASDKGEDDEGEDGERKSRLNRQGGDDNDDEGPRGGDLDLDDDDIEKGDDWEHEEIFTDDDEAVGNDPEEREDLAPEIPAPPEIKQDEDDEDENNEEEGEGLSKSGKELKKLLGKSGGLNDSDAEEDDDDDDDSDDDSSPVLAPKKKDVPKEEPVDNSPLKPASSASAKGTPPASKSSKGKRKNGDDAKSSNSAPSKKVKIENDVKPSKTETPSNSKSSVSAKAPSSSTKAAPTPPTPPSTGPVTEDEIRAVLMQKTPVTTQDLVARFKSRLKGKEDKDAFAGILRRISRIQKTNGPNYVVLRER